MSKRSATVLAIIGAVIFVAGLLGWIAYRQARSLALSQDAGNVLQPPVEGLGCADLVATINLEQRVMTENESQALVVTLGLPAGISCTVSVSLLAPDFTVAPPEITRLVTVPAGGELDVVWVISPQELGTYELVLIVDNRSQTIGVTVTNALGLTAVQAQVVSIIATFLGPMLTAPWWYERWKERQREQKDEEAKKAAQEAEKEARPGGRTIPFE